MTIIRNSAKCKTCDVELVSEHRHDFKVHTCPNSFMPKLQWEGDTLVEAVPRRATWNWGVDGGRAYLKRMGAGFTETSIFSEDLPDLTSIHPTPHNGADG